MSSGGDNTPGDQGETKHPLQNSWQLWFFKPDKNKDWSDCLQKVTKVDTVEDFWALYNHIELASGVQVGCDYCLFKDEIQPMWEDPANKMGGRWLFSIPKKQSNRIVDDLWLEIMLCLIGEAFGDDSDEVCGAVINVRRQMDKVAVWTASCQKPEAIQKIGRIIKERTHYQGQIVYESHKDSAGKQGSTARHLYAI